ncbi:MAG TPA: hypothetical protein VFL41_00900 [Gaiellaceae bacterium]|nr:hypothetical protein [Gaiellaceae bacterium]HET8653516.1 hypothetical protein [Gaiellaceae bacterium]
MKTLRLLWMGWLFQFKQLSRSAFDSFLAVLWPLFFGTVAFFMFQQGGDPEALVYAGLGAAVMGIWTATSMAAGTALHRERWLGTLELLVATPPISHWSSSPSASPRRRSASTAWRRRSSGAGWSSGSTCRSISRC